MAPVYQNFCRPPDSAMWWSGGLLKNSPFFLKVFVLMGTESFVSRHLYIFLTKYHVLQGLLKCFVQEKVNSVSYV